MMCYVEPFFAILEMNEPNSEGASRELAMARQILEYIMSSTNIAFPFMERIDAQALDLPDYDRIVRFPMWLKKSE